MSNGDVNFHRTAVASLPEALLLRHLPAMDAAVQELHAASAAGNEADALVAAVIVLHLL